MQLLIQGTGAVFQWDKKNPWVERGEDGRFGSKSNNSGTNTEDSDEDLSLFSNKELLKIVNRITGKQEVDTGEVKKVIDNIKSDTKRTNIIDKISKTFEENKDNPTAIAGGLAVLVTMSLLFHRSSAFETLKNFAKKNGINLDNINIGKKAEKEISGEELLDVNSVYKTIHNLADEELREVCKNNGISVPQVSMMTRGRSQEFGFHRRAILNKNNNQTIEYSLNNIIKGLNINDLIDAEDHSILIMKTNQEVQITIKSMTTNRKDFRGRSIVNNLDFIMRDEGAKTENFTRRLTKMFLDGKLDKTVEECMTIFEDANEMHFNLNTAKLISRIISETELVDNSTKTINKGVAITQNADEVFKEISEELTNFSLPWKKGIVLSVTKGVSDSKNLKKAGVYKGVASF